MYYGEKFNSISHLFGAALALMGFGALLAVSIQQNDWVTIASFSVFGVTLVMLYTVSTLYHSFRNPALKRILRKFDHVAIYLLIAGTYTPFTMVSLADGNGPLMLLVVWSLAVVGILLDIYVRRRIEVLQLLIYLVMGWICVFEYDNLRAVIAAPGITWLVIGGLFYTVGIIFYVLDHKNKLPHAHGIWHLFVLMGSASHFISVIGYVR